MKVFRVGKKRAMMGRVMTVATAMRASGAFVLVWTMVGYRCRDWSIHQVITLKKLRGTMKPPRLDDILSVLRQHQDELSRDYGVSSLGVFGSCARDESTEESDVDILVEFSRPVGFFQFLELEEKLSARLGANVDLVTRGALKPRIGQQILREVTML